jgi:hypothetical protein
MGTRSITHITFSHEGAQAPIVSFYRQFDGYPEGHGLEMAEFLAGFPKHNVPFGQRAIGNSHKGHGDLAFQLLAHLKQEPFNLYPIPAGGSNMGEEYVYEVDFAQEGGCTIRINSFFTGTPEQLIEKFGQKVEPAIPPVFEDGQGY